VEILFSRNCLKVQTLNQKMAKVKKNFGESFGKGFEKAQI
jgi:hypothetical protein